MAGFTPGPWEYCCDKCVTVGGDAYPIAEITHGDWGDNYPALRFTDEPSLVRKVEAYVDQITYGNVPPDVARANAHLIAAAPDLFVSCEKLIAAIGVGGNLLHDLTIEVAGALAKARGEQPDEESI